MDAIEWRLFEHRMEAITGDKSSHKAWMSNCNPVYPDDCGLCQEMLILMDAAFEVWFPDTPRGHAGLPCQHDFCGLDCEHILDDKHMAAEMSSLERSWFR